AELEGAVRPEEEVVHRLLGLGREGLAQVLGGEDALLHEDAAQHLPVLLLPLERPEQLLLGDEAVADEELAQRLPRVVRPGAVHRAVLEDDPLLGCRPPEVEGTRLAAGGDPLEHLGQAHGFQLAGEAHPALQGTMRRMKWHGTALVLAAALLAPGAWAADTVSIVSTAARGNFHAGGVVLTIAGDDNRNAAAALEWRTAGGGTFMAAQPLLRADATHLVGSLFTLLPGRSYDVRVTLSDPDGVVGASTASAVLATRADALAEPSLRTLYVSPAGDDTHTGTSPGAALRTVQKAADLAQAGDLVSIAPGVYRETVTVPRSGTAAEPIVFRGGGPGAVLDGGEPSLENAGGWSAQAGGVFARVPGFATGHAASEQGRLFRYGSLAELTTLAAGAPGGFFFDGTTLFVKMADLSSPSAH